MSPYLVQWWHGGALLCEVAYETHEKAEAMASLWGTCYGIEPTIVCAKPTIDWAGERIAADETEGSTP